MSLFAVSIILLYVLCAVGVWPQTEPLEQRLLTCHSCPRQYQVPADKSHLWEYLSPTLTNELHVFRSKRISVPARSHNFISWDILCVSEDAVTVNRSSFAPPSNVKQLSSILFYFFKCSIFVFWITNFFKLPDLLNAKTEERPLTWCVSGLSLAATGTETHEGFTECNMTHLLDQQGLKQK